MNDDHIRKDAEVELISPVDPAEFLPPGIPHATQNFAELKEILTTLPAWRRECLPSSALPVYRYAAGPVPYQRQG